MQEVKLTRAQRLALELLNKRPGNWYDYYDVMRNGGTANTLVILVNQGLVVRKEGTENFKEWKITEAGQAALNNGRFVKVA